MNFTSSLVLVVMFFVLFAGCTKPVDDGVYRVQSINKECKVTATSCEDGSWHVFKVVDDTCDALQRKKSLWGTHIRVYEEGTDEVMTVCPANCVAPAPEN